MDSEARTFPPHPIRGVQAVYAFHTGHPHDLAVVTVDFEPWEEGITFQVAAHLDIDRRDAFSQSEIATFHTALDTGIREELAELGAGTTAAARCGSAPGPTPRART
ncbi:hypothetical protein [Streptomyces chattanoogensis]|uniref:hypothetical protein n=1 Tax=Streptomyces chattanoogensis TaxID=66876 RepID=UPI0036768185